VVKTLLPELNNEHLTCVGIVISGRVRFHRVQDKFVITRTKHHSPKSSSFTSADSTPCTASDRTVVRHLAQEKYSENLHVSERSSANKCLLWELYILFSAKDI